MTNNTVMCFGCDTKYEYNNKDIKICSKCPNEHNYGPVLCDSCNTLFVDTGDCYSCTTCIKKIFNMEENYTNCSIDYYNVCKTCGDSGNYKHEHKLSIGCCCGCDIIDIK